MGPISKWFLFVLAFGLLPYGLSVFFAWLSRADLVTPHSPELLFFSLMVSASALGELWDRKKGGRRQWFFTYAVPGLIILVAASASLWGAYAYHTHNEPAKRFGAICTDPAAGSSEPRNTSRNNSGDHSVSLRELCREWRAMEAGLFNTSCIIALLVGLGGTVSVVVHHKTRRYG